MRVEGSAYTPAYTPPKTISSLNRTLSRELPDRIMSPSEIQPFKTQIPMIRPLKELSTQSLLELRQKVEQNQANVRALVGKALVF